MLQQTFRLTNEASQRMPFSPVSSQANGFSKPKSGSESEELMRASAVVQRDGTAAVNSMTSKASNVSFAVSSIHNLR